MRKITFVFLLVLLAWDTRAWDLGDLGPFSSRLAIDWGDLDNWADAYDTQAELEALGWTVVDIVDANCDAPDHITCAADTTAPKDEDEACVKDIIAENCSAGSTCNKIFRFQSSCQYDFLAGTSDGVASTPELVFDFNNYAVIGSGMTSTYIAFNDEPGTSSIPVENAIGNTSGGWISNPASTIGSAFTWESGSAKDTVVVTLADGGPNTCTTLIVGDPILMTGGDEDAATMQMQNRVAAKTNCVVTLTEPLPTTWTTTSTVQEINNSRTKKNIFLDIHIGYPLIPSTVCSTDTGSNFSCTLARFHGVEELLMDRVWLGPYAQVAIDQRGNWRTVIRNGIGGDGMTSKTRGTRTGFMTGNPFGSYYEVYNMWFKNNAIRGATISTDAAAFSYIGMNYWEDMDCSLDERAIFINHDGGFTNNGHWLLEANDMECYVFNQAENAMPRYGTLFRNRSDRDSGHSRWGSVNDARYVNFFMNRFMNWYGPDISSSFSGASLPNSVGRWNISEVSTFPTPGGSGADWATGSTNQVTTGPNSNCPLDLPASIFFNSDTPPSWACRESFGPNESAALANWQSGWTFGACDGQDGVTYKLSAQILAESGTCTLSWAGMGDGGPNINPGTVHRGSGVRGANIR